MDADIVEGASAREGACMGLGVMRIPMQKQRVVSAGVDVGAAKVVNVRKAAVMDLGEK